MFTRFRRRSIAALAPSSVQILHGMSVCILPRRRVQDAACQVSHWAKTAQPLLTVYSAPRRPVYSAPRPVVQELRMGQERELGSPWSFHRDSVPSSFSRMDSATIAEWAHTWTRSNASASMLEDTFLRLESALVRAWSQREHGVGALRAGPAPPARGRPASSQPPQSQAPLEAFPLGVREECAPRTARSTSVGALLLRQSCAS